jgi:hypothetical protein
MPIKHTFVSQKSDDPDVTLVNPSDWNANHDVDMSINELSDVNIVSPLDGNVLIYDNATGKWVSGSGTDSDAIHDNVASEIHSVAEKTTPADNDELLIEDSADSYNKKRVKMSNLPSGDGVASGNLALYKSYTLSPAPNTSYPDTGDNILNVSSTTWSAIQKLTDGQLGSKTYADGTWVGWNSQSPTIRLDLASAQSGRLFIIKGMYGASGIYRPIAIHLQYSDNDITWTTVENRTGMASGGLPGMRYWTASFDISASGEHRYWRVSLTYDTQWLFVGEIEFWT